MTKFAKDYREDSMFFQRALLRTTALTPPLALALSVIASPHAWSQDCDLNGIPDRRELVGPFRMADSDVRMSVRVEPREVVTADFNGDGNVDAATAYAGSGDVSVLLGNGDGTLQAERRVRNSGLSLAQLVVADINGDSHADLVRTSGTVTLGEISVLLGNGTGSFPSGSTVQTGAVPTGLAAADFDRDGRMDVAALTLGRMTWFAGQADGKLVEQSSLPCGGTGWSGSLTADFNRDGWSDIFFGGWIRGAGDGLDNWLFMNQGDGTFEEVNSGVGGLEGGDTSSQFAAGDFDGDDVVDIVVVQPGVVVFRGLGDGTFLETIGPSSSYHDVWWALPAGLVAADFNGDERLDVLGGGAIYLGNGDGTLQKAPHERSDALGPIAVADFNHDRRMDLVAAYPEDGEVGVLLGKGDGTFLGGPGHYDAGSYDSVGSVDRTPAVGDFNSDGRMDLATISREGLVVLRQRPDGVFERAQALAESLPGDGLRNVGIEAADFNMDGHPDLVTAYELEFGYWVYFGRGDGTFQASVQVDQWGQHLGISPLSIGIGDFDGDLVPDLLNPYSGYFWHGNGDGSFARVGQVFREDLCWTVPVDLNGDRRLDLAGCGCGGRRIVVLLNRGNGTFARNFFWKYVPLEEEAFAIAAGDFDADGNVDLITANPYAPPSRGLTRLLGSGAGRFDLEPPRYFDGGPLEDRLVWGRVGLSVGDLNGDGKLDVATSKGWVVFGRGDGTFEAPFQLRGLPDSDLMRSLRAADLDGDGLTDLVGTTGSFVSILYNRTQIRDCNHNEVLDSCEIEAGLVDDFDQDGVPDACESRPHFHRGDPNSSGTTDISDAVAIFGYLFLGDPPAISCRESADSNNDGTIDISDGIYVLSWLFTGGPEPVAPGPTGRPCGVDPDPAGSPGDIGCIEYAPCR